MMLLCPVLLLGLHSMSTGKAYRLTKDKVGITSESLTLNHGVESWVYYKESRSIGKNKIVSEGDNLSPFQFGGCYAAYMPVIGRQDDV